MVVFLGIAALALTGRTLPLPSALTRLAETRLEAAFAPYQLSIGGGEVVVTRDGTPRIALREVSVAGPGGQELLRVARMRARLAPERLMQGHLVPTVFEVSGGEVRLLRRVDGDFDLALGGGLAGRGSIPELLDTLDRLTAPGAVLAALDRVSAADLTIILEDARTGRVWTVTDGAVDLRQTPDALALSVTADVFNGTETMAAVEATLDRIKGAAGARLRVAFRDATALDIAQQTPVLAALAVLDARVSGLLDARFGATPGAAPALAGTEGLIALSGTLDLGAGALSPVAGAAPVAFRAARAGFAFDAAAGRLDLEDIVVDSDRVTSRAAGRLWLTDIAGGWPGGVVGQVRLSATEVHAQGMATPSRFDAGWLDFALALDPFTLRVGQATLQQGETRLTGHGAAAAGPDGWQVAADISTGAIATDTVLGLWPDGLVPGTRRWVDRNVRSGRIAQANAALRLDPGGRPRWAADLSFADAIVRVQPALPPVADARGRIVLDPGGAMVLVLDAGRLTAPRGGALDVAGTVFRIADVTRRPGMATLDLQARGSAEAAMSVLALPPVRLSDRTGLAADAVQGMVTATARVSFPMLRQVPPDAIDWQATAQVAAVDSAALVPGRRITADVLDIVADPSTVDILGTALVDGVPVAGRFRQVLAPDGGAARIEGRIDLTPDTLATFGVALPRGTVTGAGAGDLVLDLPRGAAPEFALTSDLAGMALALPQIGWRKAAGATGRLEVAGRLGAEPDIARLTLEAAGLLAEGRVDLAPGGAFRALRLSRLRVGRWLDGPVTLTARGPGAAPAIAMSGGRLDLRGLPGGAAGGAARGGGQGGAAPQGAPLSLVLDRVAVSEGIAIEAFRGDFTLGGTLSGPFSGRLNGGVPLRGRIDPAAGGGMAVRVQADNAGRAARDIGLFRGAAGGALDLTLVPNGGDGRWRGEARITGTRLRDAPAIAQLLSAISVVGLIEQMGGDGIPFSEVNARFRLSPGLVRLDALSAEGPSLGMSLDGIYDTTAQRLDMQGTVSPVYFLNAIGQVVSARAGEGLFAFSFRMTGPTSGPRVQVNPLSILTPGGLRDIFRRPPATATRDAPPG